MGSERETETEHLPARSLWSERARPQVSWSDAAGPHQVQLDRPMLIGASEGAALCIRGDRLASRVHAELRVEERGVWVRDLGSRNGTRLEGVQVREARVPDAGGTLEVGGTTLRVGPATAAKVKLWPSDRLGDLIGGSDAMRELLMRISELARVEAPVLVQGETGTGKELVARGLHALSQRQAGPFVVVDCGALAEQLLESELFGHAKGAFTGALSTRVGAFEAASGGTVFLDEIGELPLSMQPRLLRVLESRTVKRLGENEQRPVDLRIVSASHRDLEGMVAAGTFREDLYFRLSVVPLRVPPLRGHAEDLEALAVHFLAGRAALPEGALERMARYSWPGNVRELRNVIERTVALGFETAWAMATGAAAAPRVAVELGGRSGAPPVDTEVPFKTLREQWTDALERQYLEALIARLGRDSPMALAEAAGLDRSYMHRLLKKHLL